MRGAIRFVAVLLSAAGCGALGALLALPVALVTPEVVGWPLALAAGALCSSLGAFRAGKRFSSPADRGRGRLLPIVGASGTVTAVVAVVILGLTIPVAPPTVADHPRVLLVGVGFVAFAAAVTALPPRDRARVAVATVTLLALAVVLAATVPITLGPFGCDSDERAVFGEFPQYGGARIEPKANAQTGGCRANYSAPGGREEVRSYFLGRLAEGGWEIEHEMSVPSNSEITARRGEFVYLISYFPVEGSTDPPRRGTGIVVIVGRG